MPHFADIDNDPGFQQQIGAGQPMNWSDAPAAGSEPGGFAGPGGGPTSGPGASAGNAGVYDPTAGGAAPSGGGTPSGGGGGGGQPSWVNDPQYANINPQLKQAFLDAGVTPTGRGTGNTDIGYWNDKMASGDANYFLGRVKGDLSGHGMDSGGGGGGGFSGFSGGSVPNFAMAPAAPPPKVDLPAAFQATPFQAPDAFHAPDPSQVTLDPSYKFDLEQGLGSIQSSAAAKGMLNDPATLKAVNDYAQGRASNEYQNIYNRALNTYQTNYSNGLQANQLNNSTGLGAYSANVNAALGKGQLALGGYNAQNQYNLGVGNLGLGYYNAANNFTLGQGQLGLGYYNAGNNFALGQADYGLRANDQQFYQNYAFPIQTGLQAANATGQFGSQYGANGSNLITGAGNAGAAGQVGSANAWAGGIGNAVNTGLGSYYMNQMYPRTPTTTGSYGAPGYGMP